MHIICYEFRCEPDSKLRSHKLNGPGVSFDVVTDPVDGHIRWVNGPQPASTRGLTFLHGGKRVRRKNGKSHHVTSNYRKVLGW